MREPSPLWCQNDAPHSEHRRTNGFGGYDYCSGRPEQLLSDRDRVYAAWRDRGAGKDVESVSEAFNAGWEAYAMYALPSREKVAEALWRANMSPHVNVSWTGTDPWMNERTLKQADAVLAQFKGNR